MISIKWNHSLTRGTAVADRGLASLAAVRGSRLSALTAVRGLKTVKKCTEKSLEIFENYFWDHPKMTPK